MYVLFFELLGENLQLLALRLWARYPHTLSTFLLVEYHAGSSVW
jgi:hypothetical protein